MLTGKELGAAIEQARIKKNMTKKALAEHFGKQPPSVQDWVHKGTFDKGNLDRLWALFADVVGPEHWGLALPAAWLSQPAVRIESDAARTELSLADALEILGMHLAKEMPEEVRDDLADALAKLARRRGAARDQQQIHALLAPATPHRKQA